MGKSSRLKHTGLSEEERFSRAMEMKKLKETKARKMQTILATQVTALLLNDLRRIANGC